MSPHAPALTDAVAIDDAEDYSGSLAEFGDPAIHAWRGDRALARALTSEFESLAVPYVVRSHNARLRAGVLDHGALVPLSFLDPAQHFPLVVVSLSYLPYAAHRRSERQLRRRQPDSAGASPSSRAATSRIG